MKEKPLEPRQVLEDLIAMRPLPSSLGPADVERARGLAGDPARATRADLEALPEPLALAVLEAAVIRGTPSVADAVARSDRKALAKAGKRALYRLRSTGHVLAEPSSAFRPASPPPPAAELPCLLSAVTGDGSRALILARAVKNGVETVQTVISDETGVAHLGARIISRGEFRRMRRDVASGKAPPAIEIPLDQARALIGHAAALNLKSKTPFPEGTEDVLRHLAILIGEHEPEIPVPLPGDVEVARESGALHDEPEIKAWLPPMDRLQSFALRLDEISTSRLFLDERQREDQIRAQIERSASELFTPAVSRLYARRLWATGEFLEATGRNERAAIAKAEARVLFHGARPAPSPFARRMFEKVLELTAKAAVGEALPVPSAPLVRPP